jgi:hypothetical protein
MGDGVPYLTCIILNLLKVGHDSQHALECQARVKIPLVFVG